MRIRDRAGTRSVGVRTKVWLEADGQYVFGLGISNILKAVDQEGSIKAAAAVVGKSYRHIWTRVKEAEQALGIPLVQTTVGGHQQRRSQLTPAGLKITREFERLRRRVFSMVEKESASILRTVRTSCEDTSS